VIEVFGRDRGLPSRPSMTLSGWASTSSASGWSKIVRSSVRTHGCADFGTLWPGCGASWVRHLGQLAPPRVAPMASNSPASALVARGLSGSPSQS